MIWANICLLTTLKSGWSDSPRDAKNIISKLANWAPFSNSSPVEGINAAIQTFYKPGRKISIYTLGDDYQGRSIRNVVKAVDKLNKAHRGARPISPYSRHWLSSAFSAWEAHLAHRPLNLPH